MALSKDSVQESGNILLPVGDMRNSKLENIMEKENLGDLGVDGVIKLQLVSKNSERKLNELNCATIGYLSELL